MLAFTVHCAAPRSELRETPAGRSLKIAPPLSSRPVRIVQGVADEPVTNINTLRLRNV